MYTKVSAKPERKKEKMRERFNETMHQMSMCLYLYVHLFTLYFSFFFYWKKNGWIMSVNVFFFLRFRLQSMSRNERKHRTSW